MNISDLYTSIGHIIIGQLHYMWGKNVEQSIVLGILTLTIPLHPSIIYEGVSKSLCTNGITF